jgi:hypothetical protein
MSIENRPMLDPTQAPEAESDRRRRRLTNVFIGAFLAFQVAMPLRYYLGDRDYDERFSWRMFSTLRLRDCDVRVSETLRAGETSREEPVAIERDVQVAWVRLLERMRRAVVDKYLLRRCEREHVERVEYVRTCKDTDGQALPALRRVLRCGESEPQQTEGAAP